MSSKGAVRAFAMVIGVSALFFVAELVTAIMTRSLALEADAFHMLSDVLAMLTGFFAAKLAQRPPTLKATFGWSRDEVRRSRRRVSLSGMKWRD